MKNLKQLFESDLLNEETKTVLHDAFDVAISENKAELETQYATRFNEVKQEMTASVMEMVEEAVTEELSLVADELSEARTLEVRYAQKLEEFKESYDEKLQEQMKDTVNTIVREEIDEMKDDIAFAKKHQFVMDMFESYKDVYEKTFGESDFSVHEQLETANQKLEAYRRNEIIESLLGSVSGSKREVALTILEGVATDKLETKFDSIRPVLLAEEDAAKIEETDEAKEVDLKGKQVVMESGDDVKPVNSVIGNQLARSLRLATRR